MIDRLRFFSFHLTTAEVPPTARLLVISGQTGTTREDGSAVTSAAEQYDQAYTSVSAALVAAGLGWGDGVKRTTWMTAECSLTMTREAVAKGCGGAMFPSSAVVTDALSEGCFVEIEVVAAKVDDDSADADTEMIKFQPEGSAPPTPPGLWVCVTVPPSSRLLFVSGQVCPATHPPEAATEIYEQLGELLDLAEMGWDDVVKRSTFRTPGWDRSADIEAGRVVRMPLTFGRLLAVPVHFRAQNVRGGIAGHGWVDVSAYRRWCALASGAGVQVRFAVP